MVYWSRLSSRNPDPKLEPHKKLARPVEGKVRDSETGHVRKIDSLAVSRIIDFLRKRGHDYHDILDVYPLELVLQLVEAGYKNDKLEKTHFQVQTAISMTVAVSQALDLAFNKGKGKVLEKYIDKMLSESWKRGKERKETTENI